MKTGKRPSAAVALTLLWGPTVVGGLSMIALRNLYGVAVLFTAYTVAFVAVNRLITASPWTLVAAAVSGVVAVLLVVIQGQL